MKMERHRTVPYGICGNGFENIGDIGIRRE